MSDSTRQKLIQLAISVIATLLALWADRSVQVQPPTIGPKTGPAVPGLPQPQPVPPPAPEKMQHPVESIGKIRFGSAGCTATVVGPRREDGQYDVLTASHCIESVGDVGTMELRSGAKFRVRARALDRKADWCWLVTIDAPAGLPLARLATASAPEGVTVRHCGFGIDKPGNIEEGTTTAGPDARGQCEYFLSVSPGDSGGAIYRVDTGEVLSPVCCTSRLSGKGRVFGACPEACAAGRK